MGMGWSIFWGETVLKKAFYICLLLSLLLSSFTLGAQELSLPNEQATKAETQISPDTQGDADSLLLVQKSPEMLMLESLSYRQSTTAFGKAVQGETNFSSHIYKTPSSIEIPDGNAIYAKFISDYTSAGGKKWLNSVMQRADPYRTYIAERLHFYNLPDELFYLPVIESGFAANAVSKSGAVGLWQFMKNSIGGYDMKIDEWRDDRKDFMKASDGALRKLKYNYDYFGSWPLALAAYNCGVGKLDRAIKSSGIKDYWVLSEKKLLPKETIYYVPKFLAISALLQATAQNNLDIRWPTNYTWEKIPLEKAVDITLLAEKAKIPLQGLRLGNPELKYNITPPGDKSYMLKVESQYAPQIRETLKDPDLPLMKFNLYTIKAGDTLSALSKHYDVSVSMIQQYNPGLKPNTLKLGAKIVIPALKDVAPYVGKATVSAKPGDILAFTSSYTVKKGDTFWAISLLYNVQPEVLAAKNNMTINSVIREGMVLKVPIIQ